MSVSAIDFPTDPMLFRRGVAILASDGQALFTLRLKESGALEVSAGGIVNHNNCILEAAVQISPQASNVVTISRQLISLSE